MAVQIVVPTLAAFAVTALLGPLVIPFLRRLKVGQTERKELASHQKKTGTPTMGGIMILAGLILVSICYVPSHPQILPVLLVTMGFGLIGFLDDFLKVVLRRSDGLLPWQKMLGQIVVTGLFAAYMIKSGTSLRMLVPFTGGYTDGIYLNLGFAAIPVLFLAVIGTVNGANFTDGLDGLASTVTLVIAIFLTVATILLDGALTPITCGMAGALMAFLLFNVYPAKVFMGDTGSLALGGFVASCAYMMNLPIFILLIALIYWVEVLSVMLQVGYFKMTGGKRIFRMAPIHHHFELGGWSETRVVAVFSIVTALLCLIAYLGL